MIIAGIQLRKFEKVITLEWLELPETRAKFLAALWAIVLSPAVLDARTWRSSLYPADWKPPVGLSFAGDKMIQDFSYAGYRRGEVGIPTPDTNILNVVTQYGAELRGLANYYALATNVANQIYKVKYSLRQSMLKTLVRIALNCVVNYQLED